MSINQAIEEAKKPAEQRIAKEMSIKAGEQVTAEITGGALYFLSIKAGEQVTAEIIGGALYFFCQSELGALRIAYQYRYCGPDKVRVGYSKNLNVWYASVEKH